MRNRIAIVVCCVLLSGLLFYVAHTLDNDPGAEARFAQNTVDSNPVTRKHVPLLRTIGFAMLAAAVLALVAPGSE